MLELSKLEWDTKFFEVPVYALDLTNESEIEQVYSELIGQAPSLVYVSMKDYTGVLHEMLVKRGALLCDTRIVYKKELNSANLCNCRVRVEAYNGDTTKKLEELALQSGLHSRFRNDEKLRPYFKGFFKTWVRNSLNGQIADKTFVALDNKKIMGFITCRVKEKDGWIGLISVDREMQLKGIGTSLMAAVENYYLERNIKNSLVITQKDNLKACRFYESCDYVILQREFIYHWWI